MKESQTFFVELAKKLSNSYKLIDLFEECLILTFTKLNHVQRLHNSERSAFFIKGIETNNEQILLEYIEKNFGKQEITDHVKNILHLYFLGCIGYLHDEMISGKEDNPRKIAEILIAALPKELEKYFL